MVGLRISPLRGLITFWDSSGYNLIIPSRLKKITTIVQHNQSQRDDTFLKNKVYNTKTNPKGVKLL
jgi:hypothetical protein